MSQVNLNQMIINSSFVVKYNFCSLFFFFIAFFLENILILNVFLSQSLSIWHEVNFLLSWLDKFLVSLQSGYLMVVNVLLQRVKIGSNLSHLRTNIKLGLHRKRIQINLKISDWKFFDVLLQNFQNLNCSSVRNKVLWDI